MGKNFMPMEILNSKVIILMIIMKEMGNIFMKMEKKKILFLMK